LPDLVIAVSDLLHTQGHILSVAESCTGGLISAAITELPGASKIFDRAFITYSNAAKQNMLGVTPQTLHSHGAVSSQCAEEMAIGALKNSLATIAISVTGIAGPNSDSTVKPVGLVYIALAYKDSTDAIQVHSTENNFTGTRHEIRKITVNQLFKSLIKHLESMQ